MKKIILILLVLIVGVSVEAGQQTYQNVVVDQVTSIYDGDTFRCNINGWPPIIGHRIGIRINGIDTPEMRDKRPAIRELARQAKMFAVEKLRTAKQIELRNIKRGKYFRIVADVYVDGKLLAGMLIKAGLAKPYDGGKKPKW
jgi:endonuclease YncB( thermonuclease family)